MRTEVGSWCRNKPDGYKAITSTTSLLYYVISNLRPPPSSPAFPVCSVKLPGRSMLHWPPPVLVGCFPVLPELSARPRLTRPCRCVGYVRKIEKHSSEKNPRHAVLHSLEYNNLLHVLKGSGNMPRNIGDENQAYINSLAKRQGLFSSNRMQEMHVRSSRRHRWLLYDSTVVVAARNDLGLPGHIWPGMSCGWGGKGKRQKRVSQKWFEETHIVHD